MHVVLQWCNLERTYSGIQAHAPYISPNTLIISGVKVHQAILYML